MSNAVLELELLWNNDDSGRDSGLPLTESHYEDLNRNDSESTEDATTEEPEFLDSSQKDSREEMADTSAMREQMEFLSSNTGYTLANEKL